MIIYPGETTTLDFTVPYLASVLSKAAVTLRQDGITRVKLITTDIREADENSSTVTCTLSQQDSLRLVNNVVCYVQINLLTVDGARLVGSAEAVDVGEQHYEQMLV